MSKLTSQERLDLKKLLRESDTQDNTEHIRTVKHSVKIRDDIRELDKLKRSSIGPVEEAAAKAALDMFEHPLSANVVVGSGVKSKNSGKGKGKGAEGSSSLDSSAGGSSAAAASP
jgi:hypothetical protein